MSDQTSTEWKKFRLTKEQARKAAAWWAERIRAPEYKNTTPEEDAHDPNAGMIAVLKSLAAHTKPDDIVERFRKNLEDALLQVEFWPGNDIGCDYHPDRFLYAVGKSAGLEDNLINYPWKTWMYFYPDRIEVTAGYGSAPVRL